MSYRTPLTDDQYSELVVALELMRDIYARGYAFQPQHLLKYLWADCQCSAWCMVYLTQWFGRVGQDSAHIPHMVAELCKERTCAQ